MHVVCAVARDQEDTLTSPKHNNNSVSRLSRSSLVIDARLRRANGNNFERKRPDGYGASGKSSEVPFAMHSKNT